MSIDLDVNSQGSVPGGYKIREMGPIVTGADFLVLIVRPINRLHSETYQNYSGLPNPDHEEV